MADFGPFNGPGAGTGGPIALNLKNVFSNRQIPRPMTPQPTPYDTPFIEKPFIRVGYQLGRTYTIIFVPKPTLTT